LDAYTNMVSHFILILNIFIILFLKSSTFKNVIIILFSYIYFIQCYLVSSLSISQQFEILSKYLLIGSKLLVVVARRLTILKVFLTSQYEFLSLGQSIQYIKFAFVNNFIKCLLIIKLYLARNINLHVFTCNYLK